MSPGRGIFGLVGPDVLDIRVVETLVRLINRRWRLAVRLWTAEGSPFPEQEDGNLFRCCSNGQPLLDRPDDSAECDRAGPGMASLARAHLGQASAGAERVGCVRYTCPAGLQVMLFPLVIDHQIQGLISAGGYLRSGAHEPDNAPPRLHNARKSCDLPALSASDEDYLDELLQLITQEIVQILATMPATTRAADPGRPGPDGEHRDPRRPTRHRYDAIIGQSPPMLELYHLLDRVIDSDSTVLIQGENGTGKELVAKAIHYNSARRDHRFVVQNCSAFNDNLLDSELFGHRKGSFTGAVSDKRGLFEVADGSTFFLDEIGDMSPALQVKLLRVLQEGTFIPVGDTRPKTVDVRIIAATNRDLKQMVQRGEFREDLYYRINVIGIRIPPLRDRKADILPLVENFMNKHARGDPGRLKTLTPGCLDALMTYDWPGNVRELENEIERMVVLAGAASSIGEDLLSARIRQVRSSGSRRRRRPTSLPEAIRDLERRMIYEVLRDNQWNKTRAAKELGISRRNLIRKVNTYRLYQTDQTDQTEPFDPQNGY